MNILDLHPEEKREEAQKIVESMIKGERTYCPLELKSKKGVSLPVETRVWLGQWDGRGCIFGISKDLSKEQEALQKFTKLFENNPALMAITILPDRIFTDVNTSFLSKLGYSKNEILGHTAAELDLFVQRDKQRQIADALNRFGSINDIELKVKCKDGKFLDGLFSGEIIDNQGVKYFLTVMVDITEQKNLQKRLASKNSRLANIIDGTRLGTWEWNVQSGETIFNERWAEIVGYSLDELQPVNIQTWINLAHPDDLQKSNQLLEKHFNKETDYYDFEGRMKHKKGHWVWVHDKGRVIQWDGNGQPLMMFGTHADITEKKEMEDKIVELSIRDPLTGVYNRRHIFERLEVILSEFHRENKHFSITIIDIDHFKKLNDTYGHLAGDAILKELTKIISTSIRPYDLLGRYGGEEFIIVIINNKKEKALKKIQTILETIRSTVFTYDKHEMHITFSGGISDTSDFESHITSVEEIIQKADVRLYNAKNAGRNTIIATD